MILKKKYIRNCQSLFPIVGREEKRYLKRLEVQADEYLSEHTSATYGDLVSQFGSPKEILEDYYEEQDSPQLLKRIKTAIFVRRAAAVVLVGALVFWGIQFYTLTHIYQEDIEQSTLTEDITIEED